MHINQLL